MAFSTIRYRASKSLSPLAIRATQYASNTSSVKALNFHDERISLLPRFFSSSNTNKPDIGKEKILATIESRIKIAQEHCQGEAKEIPGSPFVIIDSHEDKASTLLLKRKYENETITLRFLKFTIESKKENVNVEMRVTIEKKNSPALDVLISVFGDSFRIKNIRTILMKFLNSARTESHSELGDNMEKAFISYLDSRGINSSLVTSLREVMRKKSNSLSWLTDLKNFMEM